MCYQTTLKPISKTASVFTPIGAAAGITAAKKLLKNSKDLGLERFVNKPNKKNFASLPSASFLIAFSPNPSFLEAERQLFQPKNMRYAPPKNLSPR